MTASSSTPDRPDVRSAWEREYSNVHAYTTSYRDDLDRGVEYLLGYLEAEGLAAPDPWVECACGRGRNAIPLAVSGRKVIGLDHSIEALSRFRARARHEGVADRTLSVQHDLREPIPLPDAMAGAVLDITAVDNLVEPDALHAYGREVGRVLRPGGVFVVVTFDRDDGYYRRFLKDSPWADLDVVEDPHTGIRNRLFRGPDLDEVFGALERRVANRFDFIDEAASERWTRRFHLRIYQKPGH